MDKVYAIGEVAELCHISIKTLRYYDKIQLLVPEVRREKNKYRFYTKNQMVILYIIKKLKALGFSLCEIKNIIESDDVNTLEHCIGNRLNGLSNEIQLLQDKVEQGEFFFRKIKKGATMLTKQFDDISDIKVEYIPEVTLFYIIKEMKEYKNEEVSLDRWIEINEEAKQNKVKQCGPMITTYHSKPLEQFLSSDCSVEFAIPTKESRIGSRYKKFGGFNAASEIHLGNYGNIINTHVKVIQWVNQNGYEISGPVSEEFIISPIDINNIHEHVTRVIVPIQKA